MATPPQPHAARLKIDYPQKLDRLSTLVRVIWPALSADAGAAS